MLRILIAAMMLCVVGVSPVMADQASDLAKKLPAGGNALVVIRADALMKSQRAVSERWNDPASTARPIALPADAQSVVTAAQVNPGTFDLLWQASIVQASTAKDAAKIAAAKQGLADQLAGVAAGWTSSYYLLQLNPNQVGVVCPPNRQFAANWKKSTAPGLGSAFLTKAATENTDAAIVMALDLTDAWSAAGIERALTNDPPASLGNSDLTPSAIAPGLASIRGIVVKINVTDVISGTAVVYFGNNVSSLNPVGRDLMLEILERAGLGLMDFSQWQVKIDGSSAYLSGPLTTAGLERLLSVIDPKSAADADEATTGAAQPAGEATGAASASREYFKSVSAIVDRAASAATSGQVSWLKREAQKVSTVPMLNVDPALVVWGSTVAGDLSKAVAALELGQTKGAARAAQFQMPGGGYGTGADRESRAAADRQLVESQRRQAMLEEKATAAENAARIMSEATAQRNTVRSEMATKYQVEF